MSHFCVLVIGDNIERQLAPFQENNMGTCPEEFMVFHDLTAGYEKEFSEKSRDMLFLADGSMRDPFDEEFRMEGAL